MTPNVRKPPYQTMPKPKPYIMPHRGSIGTEAWKTSGTTSQSSARPGAACWGSSVRAEYVYVSLGIHTYMRAHMHMPRTM